MSLDSNDGSSLNSSFVKLNKSGIYRPLILQFFALRSSKNGCIKPSNGLIRLLGEYSNIFDRRSMYSGLTLNLKNT